MKDYCEEFTRELKEVLHRSAENIQPQHSFWYYRPDNQFPPEAVRYPDDYDGSEKLNIVCTQTELKSSQQLKLVQRWCETLPILKNVRFLWFNSRVPESIFEAVCRMENLVGLYIKWSGLKSICSLTKLKNLRFLHIGSSPSISPLTPLEKMPLIEWLELGNIRATSDLRFLNNSVNLRGLSLAGDSNSIKYLWADTLEPLENLQRLYWLSLDTFMSKDGSLAPLIKLRSLRYLFICNKYKAEEVAKLAGARPDIKCDLFKPVSDIYTCFKCKKCGENQMVLPTGKGLPLLCINCDIKSIAKHVAFFNSTVNKYRA